MCRKITFINPDFTQSKAKDAMQPIAFAVIAGLTPPEYQLQLFDERIENIPNDLQADMVAITVQSFTAMRAYQLAKKYREQGITVVLGGIHVSALPHEALNYCSAVVVGAAEGVWLELLHDFKNGSLKPIYTSTPNTKLDGMVFNRAVFAGKKYKRIVPVLFSRGCKYNCEFCSVDAIAGRTICHRPVAEVLSEIKQLKTKFIFFVDDNILNDKSLSVELFKGLIYLKVRWAAQMSIDACMDNDLLQLMSKSGCVSLTVGFESLNSNNLKAMHKGVNRNAMYATAINNIRKNGILLYGSFVFGYEYDTIDLCRETVKYAVDNKFFLANFNILMVFPATKLYRRFQKENRLLYKDWWLNPNYKYGAAMHKPYVCTDKELAQSCYNSRKQFNSWWSIVKRAFDFKANMKSVFNAAVFWQANLISRAEIKRKNG